MPFNIPATSDANIDLSLFNIPVTSDANIEFDPLLTFALTVANATQAQTADNVTLTVKYALTVAGATQAQTAENVDLVFHPVFALEVQDAEQVQTADKVSLTFNAPAGGNTGSAGWMAVAAYNRELYRLREVIEQEQDDEEVMAILYG